MPNIEIFGNTIAKDLSTGIYPVLGSNVLSASLAYEAEHPNLTEREHTVLQLASLGGTTEQVARLISADTEVIEQTRDTITDKFGVPTMAAAVYKAIESETIKIELELKHGRQLLPRQLEVLVLTAQGLNNRQIANQLSKNCGTFVSNIQKPLYRKIGASGRTHSIRRAYELGFFKLEQRQLHR